MKPSKLNLIFITLILSFVTLANTGYSFEDIEGNWVASVKENVIRMKLTIFDDDKSWGEWNTSSTFEKKDFTGLTMTEESNFKLVQEAGTISFNGQFKDSRGYGLFTFQTDNSFKPFLQGKGFENITDKRMLSLSLQDVKKSYVNDLVSLGFSNLSISKLISFAIHDISVNYIKDIQKLGYTDISASKIISFKVHDIDKEYIEYIRSLVKGKEITANKLITMKIQGI